MFAKRNLYAMLMALALLMGLLVACERPAQESDGAADGDLFPTATTAVADGVAPDTGADSDDEAYPPPDDEGLGDEYPGPVDDGDGDDEAPRPEDEGEGEEEDADGDGTGATDDGDGGDDADTGNDDEGADDGDTSDESADGEDGATGDEEADGGDEGSDGDTEADDETAGDGDETAGDDEEAAEEAAPRVHVVQAGETLYRIGLLYNVSWVVLAAENNLPAPYTIYVGQELRLPGGDDEAAEPTEGEEVFHTVRFGETLFSIGQRYGVSYLQIAEANGIVNPNNIVAGQVLKIPTDAPGPNQEFSHTVLPGQTLSQIAALYGVSLGAIAERNDLRAPYLIFAGQTLIIPGD